jgi:hypothetical protein
MGMNYFFLNKNVIEDLQKQLGLCNLIKFLIKQDNVICRDEFSLRFFNKIKNG